MNQIHLKSLETKIQIEQNLNIKKRHTGIKKCQFKVLNDTKYRKKLTTIDVGPFIVTRNGRMITLSLCSVLWCLCTMSLMIVIIC